MPDDVFSFTEDFQNEVLACFIHHPDKFLVYGRVLKPAYFSGVVATLAARAAINYFEANSKFPTWETLTQLICDEQTRMGEDPEQGVKFVKRLKKIKPDDVDYVVARMRVFVKERAAVAALKEGIRYMQEGKTPDSGFVSLFEEAIQVGENLSDYGYLLGNDRDGDCTDIDRIIDKVSSRDYGVKTGYPQWDGIWKRGWAPGWLVVPLAPPKRYKTALCINLAMNMVGPSYHEDVLYYACEISQELAALRALSHLTGMTDDEIFDNTEKFRRRAHRQARLHFDGNLLFKGFPQKSVRIAEIKAHAKHVINTLGLKPRCIVIDYAETIVPTNPKESEHQQSASIYTDARRMAAELGVCVVMPDRCNKETVGYDVPSMTSFQGAFQKAGIVDVAIGLCQTDDEHENNVFRSFVFLNRHGKAFQHFRGAVDPDVMRIDLGKKIEYVPESERKKGHKNRNASLVVDVPDEEDDD